MLLQMVFIYLLHCTVRSTLGLQVHLSVPCLWNSCYQIKPANSIHSLNHRGNVFISLPVFCLHLPCSTTSWSLFSNVDVVIFLTTVSVMSQCSVLGSVHKWRCCHFLNIYISDNTTVFGSVLNVYIGIFLTTVSVMTQQFLALFRNEDVAMFLTSVSVRSQQFFA